MNVAVPVCRGGQKRRTGLVAFLVVIAGFLSPCAFAAVATGGQHSSSAGQGQLPPGAEVTTTVTRLNPVQRATFMVTLTLIDRDRNLISVALHRPHGEAIVGRRIDIRQDQVETDGRRANRRVYRWAVSALQAGKVELQFARMTFNVVGSSGKDWHFTPAPRTLNVRPLPAYLPEYLPVTPGLSVTQQPLRPLEAGQPVDWVWTVRGRGLTEAGLQTILKQQLLGSPQLHIGRPEIRLAPKQAGPDPLAQTYSVRIPLLPAPQGRADGAETARLPAIRLPFVRTGDPSAATPLHYATLPGRALHWRSAGQAGGWQEWARWLAWGLVGLVLLAVSVRIVRDLLRRWRIRQAFAQARNRLRSAQDAPALLAILRQETGCATTGAMAEQAPNPRFMAALVELDAACYGNRYGVGADADIGPLREELVRWLPRPFFVNR